MESISESATLALNARVKQLAAEGQTVYNLTAGELAVETPAYIQEAVKRTLHLNKYTPTAGLHELRQAIADEANALPNHPAVSAANVVVTAGAKPALYASFMALLNPGDEVIVPVPAWLSYRHLIELAGGVVMEVPLTEEFDLNPAAITAAITAKTKAIVLNSPHNPTGAVFSGPALQSLAAELKGRGITVIADDIYSKLVFRADFTPVASVGFDNLVIINGFSKSQALTGWRIGYLIAEAPIVQAAINLLSHTMGNPAVPSQFAALAALAKHDKPPAAVMKQLRKQRQIVDEGLSKIPRLKHRLPGGAFYVLIDLRGITSDDGAWCERLLNDQQVALVPGKAFSAPGFARLSFVTDERVLVEALQRIRAFVQQDDQT